MTVPYRAVMAKRFGIGVELNIDSYNDGLTYLKAADINANTTTINGSKITTGSITASQIQAGSITTDRLVAGTLTGFTIQTAASGQRVVLASTLASFYNSSGTLIASTYADTTAYMIKGESANSSIHLNAGSNGVVSVLSNNSLKWMFDYPNRNFSPAVSGLSLGNNSYQWDQFWHSGVETYQGMDQPVIYFGLVSGGSITNDNYVPFSCSNISTGRYRITHSFGHYDYSVNVVAQASTVKNITIDSYSSSSFVVRISNLSDVLEDNDFFFQVFEYPQ
jgi:hypothetical protein